MTALDKPLRRMLENVTELPMVPHREGNNIGPWIGFKHVNYMVETAVLAHLRDAGMPERTLLEDYGLGVELVGLDTRIQHALHLDEQTTAVVRSTTDPGGGALSFAVHVNTAEARNVQAKVRVVLRQNDYLAVPGPYPEELAPYVVGRPADEPTIVGDGDVLARLTEGRNAFAYTSRIPYPHCHNTERMPMSGYLRRMEEAVDLFLADRGISIRTLLDDRHWIPVVPRSRITLLADARMEEDLHVVYTVEEIFKNLTYKSTMDTYVRRGGRLVRTATGSITHGYAEFGDWKDWRLVEFDERVVRALGGGRG
ncbi:hypothetical protein GCM10029964_083590 [Kibdelosporangium lantanae]